MRRSATTFPPTRCSAMMRSRFSGVQRPYQTPSGMKAMLPYVDEFRPVHNLESLETLVDVISAAAQRQSIAAMAQERYGVREI